MIELWAARWGIPREALDDLARTFINPPGALDGGSEMMVQQTLRVVAAQRDAALWRNNSGALPDADGRIVRYGLGNDSKRLNDVFKSSDLIGITPVRCRCGTTYGVFTAVECKGSGWTKPANAREHAQANFLKVVQQKGGIGTFAASVEDYTRAVENANVR